MHNPAVHTQTPQGQLDAIRAQKKIILGVPHWHAIPEYVAEMGTLSHQERQLKRSLGPEAERPRTGESPPAPKPAPQPEKHRILTGDMVRHTTYGDGRVIFIEYSARLKATIITVRYETGESHSSYSDDLAYIPEGEQLNRLERMIRDDRLNANPDTDCSEESIRREADVELVEIAQRIRLKFPSFPKLPMETQP